jgi:dipeptidyl aminopeptidase/acylaminoacyl peptidase
MAEVRPITYKARDGLEIDGFLTLPRGGDKEDLPLVLMPHGGPFDSFDAWAFDVDAQLLANAGYAVLKVNFRGSGNRGRAFKTAGARQWGGKMQDDLADAVRWAVSQKIADPGRVCIVGASYGGYAAMMGLALTPELFKCGVGYVGVYDLERMVAEDSRNSRASATWLRDWVGEGDMLRQASATTVADRIKAPVLLVAGGEDRIAPIAHSRAMERRLKDAGVPVETLYAGSEGHGFYEERNRRAYYTALLDFLAQHIGGQPSVKIGKD